MKSFESGSPRKFIPAKFITRRHPRKFIPAKCKYFAVFLNRESFFPRKFLPLNYIIDIHYILLENIMFTKTKTMLAFHRHITQDSFKHTIQIIQPNIRIFQPTIIERLISTRRFCLKKLLENPFFPVQNPFCQKNTSFNTENEVFLYKSVLYIWNSILQWKS